MRLGSRRAWGRDAGIPSFGSREPDPAPARPDRTGPACTVFLLLSLVNKVLYYRFGFFRVPRAGGAGRAPLWGGSGPSHNGDPGQDLVPSCPTSLALLSFPPNLPFLPPPAVLPRLLSSSGGTPRPGSWVPGHRASGLYSRAILGLTSPVGASALSLSLSRARALGSACPREGSRELGGQSMQH